MVPPFPRRAGLTPRCGEYSAPMPTASLEDVTWDLEHLVDAEGPEGVDRLLDEAGARATAFAQRYAGQVATLDAEQLAEAMAELEAILETAGRAGYYAGL